MNKAVNLSPRLLSAVSLVKKCKTAWDVGTDHCLVPIYLIERELAENVIASDVNSGPLRKAEENISSFIKKGSIALICADGLDGAELYQPEEILICGMGGELISDIIDRCPYVKTPNVHLVLQPMTKSDVLRDYLSKNGFKTEKEILVDDGKIYEILSVYYSGERVCNTDKDNAYGKCIDFEDKELVIRYLEKKREHLNKRLTGLMSAQKDCSREKELMDITNQLLKEKKR